MHHVMRWLQPTIINDMLDPFFHDLPLLLAAAVVRAGKRIYQTMAVNTARRLKRWRHGGKSFWRLLLLIVRQRAHPFSGRWGRVLTATGGGIRNPKRKQRSQARDTGYQMPASLHGKNASQG